jgi:multidrug transporter EmrE-like cation transporter
VTTIALVLVLVALVAHTVGQIFLKHAMGSSHSETGFRSRAVIVPFAIGIALMTTQFFLVLGLLQRYDLSLIYPFQGLGVIIITLTAGITLRERLSLQLVIGSLLISAGVVLVSIT